MELSEALDEAENLRYHPEYEEERDYDWEQRLIAFATGGALAALYDAAWAYEDISS